MTSEGRPQAGAKPGAPRQGPAASPHRRLTAEPALGVGASPGGPRPGQEEAAATWQSPTEFATPKGLSAPLIWGASRASTAKGVSTLSPSPVSMVTCSAPIQTAVLY